MRKDFFPRIILATSVLFLAGCSTLKGINKGIKNGAVEVGQGIAEDAKSAWHGLLKADKWFQEKCW